MKTLTKWLAAIADHSPRLRMKLQTIALFIAVVFGCAGTMRGAGQYLKVDYPASTVEGELRIAATYTLWIPDGVKTFRGIIVHQHGAGITASKEGSTAAYDLHWQALAKKWDCALLGPSYHVLNDGDLGPAGSDYWFDPRLGSDKTFVKALGEFATKTRHPELATVPWALWGHSAGAGWADVMSTLHPERVIAVYYRSGSAFVWTNRPAMYPPFSIPAASYGIPRMCTTGVKEKGLTRILLATYGVYRSHGAPAGFAQDPRTGHECGDSRYFAIPFLDACLAMRLPDTGSQDQTLKPVDMNKAWLAPLGSDTAVQAADYKEKPEESVWLPNKAVAKAWMEYIKTGAVSDTTPPPTPFNVQVTEDGDHGREIRWDAEADFESGIGGFIVMRDGKELARVPEQPAGKFGRPLFQSMTYHDTPDQPMPQMRFVDASAKHGEKHAYAVMALNSVGLKSEPATAEPQTNAAPQTPSAPAVRRASAYYFDGTISRETLERYLDRSVTMGYFLVPGKPEGYEFPYKDDDIRLIRNIGAKFIGRSIYRWGEESRLNDPAFLAYAKKMIDTVHVFDPEVVFQGCLFEQVTADVDNVKIPAWVFTDFGLPVEDRTFSCDAIIKRQRGAAIRPGRRGGVPIINNLETQLWFYYLAVSYINVGCEAFHLGQVGLIGAEDRDLKVYSEFLAKVRAYAKTHARRHLVLMDGHVPGGGMVKDGVSLLDFNSFPMRIKAVPEKPHEGILEVGHLDAIFKRSKGCISPSGWRCESLPYLVEFDNFGRDRVTNVANPQSMFCWGWDEISWFALQPEAYRNKWLRYAYNWIKETDPNGHLQMPVTRMLSCPNQTLRTYFANTKSPACPVGYSQEEAIKRIWNHELEPVAQAAGVNPGRYVFVPQNYGILLSNVADVAIDSKNNVFTIVRGETPILVFNPEGKFLYGWGKGMIAGPHGIYIDSNDNVFCVDTKNHVVLKFTTDGKLLMTLGIKGVPSDSGSVKGNFKTVQKGAGPFNVPTKVATSKSGDIFVSDGYGNARVHRFSADGKLIKSWGEPGTGPGQFNLPHGIAVDDRNNVYVADRENERIQVFDVDGNLKSIWTNIYRPSAICIHQGKVYVTELGHRLYVDNVLFTPDGTGPWARVRIFDVAGVEQANFGAPEGWKPGNFFAPHGICVDKNGAIYVAEVIWPAKESAPPKDLHPALQKFNPAD